MPQLPVHLRAIRNVLQRLNYHLSAADAKTGDEPFDKTILVKAEEALRQLPVPDAGAKAYLEKHIPRLARTLALVPPAQSTGRALELGCYMQITPFLQSLNGYQEIRGAYYGPPGRSDHKTIEFADWTFACDVDLFDAERDIFPYPDGHFDLVVAGEIIEHFVYDPMHMMVEARRVLRDGGYLLVTTPNVGSVTSVAKTLDGRDNPQIYFLYKHPRAGEEPETGHMREYTMHEIGETMKAAGFEVQSLFTTFIPEFSTHLPLLNFLMDNGFDVSNRGEQTYCLAVKRASLPVDRYPYFIYND